ncbi:hypothetical protein P8452_66182 [Trifolium repens]|nr:hypothetical protein P8452_66182 [Trifolium repens]
MATPGRGKWVVYRPTSTSYFELFDFELVRVIEEDQEISQRVQDYRFMHMKFCAELLCHHDSFPLYLELLDTKKRREQSKIWRQGNHRRNITTCLVQVTDASNAPDQTDSPSPYNDED